MNEGFRTDAFMKSWLRLFRGGIQKRFKKVNGQRIYGKNPMKLKKLIKDFFTTHQDVKNQGPAYMVPSDIYDANEIIFFKLVLSTKKRNEIESKFKISLGLDFADLMDNVFGARPSLSNLSKFFSNSVIQGLWIHGFGKKLM